MRLHETLQRWYRDHENELSRRYDSSAFKSNPPERTPASAWIELHSSDRSGHLIVWDSGAVDAHVIDASGDDVFTRHWEIEDVDALEEIVAEFERAFV
jgi:hypothetical protein